jgi:hypothetical protein
MNLPADKIQYVDLPNLSETFADALGSMTFDGQTARMELCVTRMNEPKPPNPPTARRYPVCRLVLTPEALLELYGHLHQLVDTLEKQGAIHKIEKNIKNSTVQ